MEESNDTTTPAAAPAPEEAAPAPTDAPAQPAPSGADVAETSAPTEAGGEASQEEHTAGTLQPVEGKEPEERQGGLFDSPMIWVILGAVWLWALWSMHKNKKKQHAEQERQQELFRKGARVVTIGRLHGTIVSFNDKTVTIKPDEKRDLTLTFDRNAILHAVPDAPGENADGIMNDGK